MADLFGGGADMFGKSKKKPGQRVSPERRNWVRAESQLILSKNLRSCGGVGLYEGKHQSSISEWTA